MPAKTDEHLAVREEKLRQLQASRERLEARRHAMLATRSRRENTRRKVLVGAVVLAKVEAGVIPEATLRGWLEGALEREEDRVLFGLKTGKT